MKRYSHQQIEALLDKFMDGQTTVEEEAQLADYFRSADVPAEWEDYRAMFDYFDSGMESEPVPAAETRPSLTSQVGRRWWGISAAACITAAIIATALLHHPTTTTQPEIAEVDTTGRQEPAAPIVETQDDAPVQTPATLSVETPRLASRTTSVKAANKHSRSTGRLQAENKRLAEENERLQRELADLKRRSFIIDLEANGFRAVQDEDGSIVLIDLEQELENELNNKLTTNIPAL